MRHALCRLRRRMGYKEIEETGEAGWGEGEKDDMEAGEKRRVWGEGGEG